MSDGHADIELRRRAALTLHPSPFLKEPPQRSEEEKIAYIAQRFAEILEALGLDLSHDAVAASPQRVAKMYVREFFYGIDPVHFPTISYLPNPRGKEEKAPLIFLTTSFNSFCEHHFIPMDGTVHIAYLPREKLLGFSTISKIVRFFAARPQIQERLGAQIADGLSLVLQTEDIAVAVAARHTCMISRGVEDAASQVTSYVLRGQFENGVQRQEFFAMLRNCPYSGVSAPSSLGIIK